MLPVSGYPTRRVSVQLAGRCVQLLVVKRLEDYVDTAALLRDTEAPEPPYWAHLWVGSRALARLVEAEIACTGRRIVEVGCGVGLVGVVAALRGAHVTMLDMTHAAVDFARANARLNGCSVLTLQTDLRQPGLRGGFDAILAADVTYDPILQDGLAAFLRAHLSPGGRAWCAESVRTNDAGFGRACAAHGLRTCERSLREPDEGRDVLVRVTEAWTPVGS
jgi:predicted nicotinamide N-methyase